MSDFNKRNYYIDLFGLFSLGIFSLGYIVTLKGLAEKHIQLPFLNFPIFVGEILLFVCLVLFLAKYINNPPKVIKWWHYLIFCYFIFVIIKALHGYLVWDSSPLALRHAALVYYPAFAVFGYSFYRRDFFSTRNCLILILLVAVVFIFGKYKDSGLLTLMFLGVILIKAHPDETLRLLMFLVFLVIVPYKAFFHTARMTIVSNFLSGLYLASTFPLILNISKRFKLGLAILIGGIVMFGMLKTADHDAVKSIIAFKNMAEVLKTCDEYVEAHNDNFIMEERKEVKLYNPDNAARGDAITSMSNDREIIETTEWPVRGGEKKIIIKDVKEKIVGFSSGPVDKEIQREVKQEIESILDMQLPEEAQGHSRGGGSASSRQRALGVTQVKDKARESGDHNVKNEIKSAFVGTAPESIKTVMAGVQGEVRESGANEEANTIIREIFFEQVKQEIRMAPVRNISDGEKQQYAAMIDDVKKEIQMAFTEQVKQTVPVVHVEQSKTGWVENNNAVFRILIWRDMLRDLWREKPVLGFSFGRPFRSRSLEMLHWGDGDWARDGWIEPHNSYLHIIYRTGIVGILLIFSLLVILFKMIKHFILVKSFTGILLCGIIINWFVAANFLVIFELPYTAIPIWTIYGMTFAYCYKTREADCEGKTAL